MKKSILLKKCSKLLIMFIIMFLLGTSITLAATTADLHFCDYGGVRRSFKIAGIVINIVKIVVPLIIIGTAMLSIFKTVMSGKTEDLTGSFSIILKKLIAGIIIFYIPTILDFAFDSLAEYDDSNFLVCTNCLFDTDSCSVSNDMPDTYTED